MDLNFLPQISVCVVGNGITALSNRIGSPTLPTLQNGTTLLILRRLIVYIMGFGYQYISDRISTAELLSSILTDISNALNNTEM